MAIKVKHDGNVTAQVMASAEGGRQKRAIETAKLATNQPERIQTLTPAHAGAAPINMAHAQTTHASPGAGISNAPLVGGRGVGGSTGGAGALRSSSSSSQSGGADLKVTGVDRFRRPDNESVWNDYSSQWERKWLPGEKEAEAYDRMTGAVVNRYTAQQQAEWEQLNDVVNDAARSGRYTPDELKAIKEQVDMQRLRIKENPRQLLQKEESAQQAFARNTFTDPNGLVYTRDGRLVYNPNDAMIKQREYELKRQDAVQARADKYELSLRQPYKISDVDEDGNPVTKFEMRDDAQVQDLMRKRFPQLYPSAPKPEYLGSMAAPAAQDPMTRAAVLGEQLTDDEYRNAAPVTTPAQKAKKWSSYAN